MSVRYGLLALLAEAPTHGYQLKTAFERRTGGSWALNIGQVYTTLQRLERDGLVTEAASSGGDRRDYRIGRPDGTQLEAWFSSPVVPEGPSRDELTIKVLLAVAARRRRRDGGSPAPADGVGRAAPGVHAAQGAGGPEKDLAFLILLDALIFRTEAEVRWSWMRLRPGSAT